MEYSPPDDIKHWYQLSPVAEVRPVDIDVPMAVEPSVDAAETASAQANEANDDDEPNNKTHDNTIVSYIDVIGRVRFQYLVARFSANVS